MATDSPALDRIVERLKTSSDPKRRYEYVLWLAKKLEPLADEFRQDAFKVKGCVSQVYVVAQLRAGRLHWQGDSDAAITKGLLALLIEGLEGLEPAQVASLDPAFLAETGLQASLTPSRANGFLNILAMMKAQARALQAPTLASTTSFDPASKPASIPGSIPGSEPTPLPGPAEPGSTCAAR